MYKYIFNTKGEYVAFIYDEIYCYTPNNVYIGFLNKSKLYDYNGKILGELTGDDRIVRNITIDYEEIEPIEPPKNVTLPPEPKRRLRMARLPKTYIDVFRNYKRSERQIDKVDIASRTNGEKKVRVINITTVNPNIMLKPQIKVYKKIDKKIEKTLKSKRV